MNKIGNLDFASGGLLLLSYALLVLPGLAYYAISFRRINILDIPFILGIGMLVNLLLAYFFVAADVYSRTAYLMAAGCFVTLILTRRPRFYLELDTATLLTVAAAVLITRSNIESAFLNVFQLTDAVFSWGRWATDWYSGQYPKYTMNYPQLIPANWGMLYSINGANLESAARTMMPVLVIFTAISYLGSSASRVHCVLAALTFLALVKMFYDNYLGEGYVDIAVAFLSWCAISVWFAMEQKQAFSARRIVLASLLACAAALTKQGGLITVLFLQILHLSYRHDIKLLPGGTWLVAAPLIIATVLTAPYYVVMHYLVHLGMERDVTSYLINEIHQGRNYGQRVLRAWSMITGKLSPLIAAALIILTLASFLFNRRLKFIAVFAVMAFAVWALLFSYDLRNLSVAVPLVAYAAAGVVASLLELYAGSLLQLLDRPKRLSSGTCMLAASVALVLLLVLFSRYDLAQRESRQVKSRGNPALSAFLEANISEDCSACVLTNYRYMEATESLRRYYLPQYRIVTDRSERPLFNHENFSRWAADSRVRYIVFSKKPSPRPRIREYITSLDTLISRDYRLLADTEDFLAIEFR